jgi:hypothetical protein
MDELDKLIERMIDRKAGRHTMKLMLWEHIGQYPTEEDREEAFNRFIDKMQRLIARLERPN